MIELTFGKLLESSNKFALILKKGQKILMELVEAKHLTFPCREFGFMHTNF